MKRVIIVFAILLSLNVLSGCVNKEYTGELIYNAKAKDELFGVEVDAPILIRTVEMVQKTSGESGEEFVLSNKKIDSVEGIENPDFPAGLESAIFYDPIFLGDVQLSDAIIYELAYGDMLEKKEVSELPEPIDNEFDLIMIGNTYVSRSDDFELGEVRISYSYIDSCDLKIKGQIRDGILDTKKIENIQLIEN